MSSMHHSNHCACDCAGKKEARIIKAAGFAIASIIRASVSIDWPSVDAWMNLFS
jgi:hypothetical protein